MNYSPERNKKISIALTKHGMSKPNLRRYVDLAEAFYNL